MIIGAIFAGYVGFAWHLPVVLHLIVALLAGIARRRAVGRHRRACSRRAPARTR